MVILSKTEKAFRNGNADALFAIPSNVNQFETWQEQCSYLSGYLTGQALKTSHKPTEDGE